MGKLENLYKVFHYIYLIFLEEPHKNPFYDIMNEELKDIKGSFFLQIGLYRNFIQYSMQQSLFNTIYILCKKIKLKKSSISLQKEIDDFIF